MVRFSIIIFSFCFFILSCSKNKKLELIPFPDSFYAKMGYDTIKQKYFLISGDSLYISKNELFVDSLISVHIPKGKDTFTVYVFKESSWDNFTRNDFGSNGEPFGDEWESVWGYMKYSIIEFRRDTIFDKVLFDNLNLLSR